MRKVSARTVLCPPGVILKFRNDDTRFKHAVIKTNLLLSDIMTSESILRNCIQEII